MTSRVRAFRLRVIQQMKSSDRFSRMVRTYVPVPLLRAVQTRLVSLPRMRALGIQGANDPMFREVFFEVRTKCNGTCPFCAASAKNETRRDSMMPFPLYKKIIDQLHDLDYRARIAYHVNNDPLLFPDLEAFVQYARKKLPYAWIDILTNGKALTLATVEGLLSAGIDELTVNHYSDDLDGPLPPRLQTILAYFQELCAAHKPFVIGFEGHGLSERRDLRRFNLLRRKATEVLSTRGGTAPNKSVKTNMPRGFCEYPFTQMNITTDGRVAKCCADLYFSNPMGNADNQTLMEIWQGPEFSAVRSALKSHDRRHIPNCEDCDYYGIRRCHHNFGELVYILTK